jgi:membrane associated rhomboid family serine protease
MRFFIILLVVIQLYVSLGGGVWNHAALYDWLGLSLAGVRAGYLWQLLSYVVLHGHWLHLVINVILCYFLARRVTAMRDGQTLLVLATLSAILGGVMHLIQNFFLPAEQQGLLVGASGIATGLLVYVCLLDGDYLYPLLRIRARFIGYGFILSSLLLWLMTPALGVWGLSDLGGFLEKIFGPECFTVSHACHFGGGLAAWLLLRRHGNS